ncbi:MAG: SLBB domain-containing protein, partial [Armatimonadetes bacterium]|nr:SLBB domain-containing protein [Armatimonadota bacterium]
PTEAAELAQIRISRVDGNVTRANAAKSPPDDPILEPGDRIFVPLRVGGNEITVLGAVMKPGLVPFTNGMTVSEAIRAAGGLRVDGDDTRIAVTFRAGGSSVANLTVPGSDVALAPGDQLTVPLRVTTDHVYIRGAVARPGMVPYSPGLTVAAAVSSAMPVEGARLDKVKIVRKGPDGKTRTTPVNLAKVSQGEAQDQPLLPGDVVDVPYPGKSFGMREKLQLVSLALFIYFLFR